MLLILGKKGTDSNPSPFYRQHTRGENLGIALLIHLQNENRKT